MKERLILIAIMQIFLAGYCCKITPVTDMVFQNVFHEGKTNLRLISESWVNQYA